MSALAPIIAKTLAGARTYVQFPRWRTVRELPRTTCPTHFPRTTSATRFRSGALGRPAGVGRERRPRALRLECQPERPETAPIPRRYLITGGAGFVGSHLAEALLARGDHVVSIDNLSTGAVANIEPLRAAHADRYRHHTASIDDGALMAELIDGADCVFHLAAAVGVQLVVDHPVHTIETNIMGTRTVLEHARKKNKRVLIASTSEVYGKASKVPFAEDDDMVLGPTSKARWAYAASKAVDEFLAFAHHRESGLPAVVFRLFNTVGPRQVGRYGMVIPRFVGQALTGGPITVYGDGQQSRCFCDVADVVSALVPLSDHPDAPGKVFNIGSDEEITIAALAEKVRDKVDAGLEIRYIPYDQAYGPGFEDMRRRVPDLTRIGELIGYRPTRTIDQILDRVIEHMRATDVATEGTS